MTCWIDWKQKCHLQSMNDNEATYRNTLWQSVHMYVLVCPDRVVEWVAVNPVSLSCDSAAVTRQWHQKPAWSWTEQWWEVRITVTHAGGIHRMLSQGPHARRSTPCHKTLQTLLCLFLPDQSHAWTCRAAISVKIMTIKAENLMINHVVISQVVIKFTVTLQNQVNLSKSVDVLIHHSYVETEAGEIFSPFTKVLI